MDDATGAEVLPASAKPGVALGMRLHPKWILDESGKVSGLWFLGQSAIGPAYFSVDVGGKERRQLFDPARLGAALTKATGRPFNGTKLAIERLDFDERAVHLLLRGEATVYSCDTQTYECVASGDGMQRFALAPLETVPRSREGGGSSAVVVVNKTATEVQLYWSDTAGKRVAYGKVKSGEQYRQNTYAGHVWVVTNAGGEDLYAAEAGDEPGVMVITDGPKAAAATRAVPKAATATPGPAAAKNKRGGDVSPDGVWTAVITNHNVQLKDNASGEVTPLTRDGTADDSYSLGNMGDSGVFWSPDSRRVVVFRSKKGGDRKVRYIEAAPKDQLQPKEHSYDYLKPGDVIPQGWPHLFDAVAKSEILLNRELFDNPWAITQTRWAADSSAFTFLYNQRGHRVMRMVRIDAAMGHAQAVINEEPETFFNYAGTTYTHYLEGTDDVIWRSERDGWKHLYLVDSSRGAVRNQITQGQWVVRRVERIDEAARQVWLWAGGIHPGQDPYYEHLVRVNFDGSGLTVLTEGDGTHSVEFSPDRQLFIDTYSRVDCAPVHELRRADSGALVCELMRTETGAATGSRPPGEPFVAKGRDGTTDIYGVIVRPKDFDPAKRYRVVEQIYAGPHDSFVPKAYSPRLGGLQDMADRGFVVVQIDGMGTANRNKAFGDVSWKNLADGGFLDRIQWIQAAAKVHPEMDITSGVGIYGGSAGGQNALRAVLSHGDFYKVCVADCGCHDNRMDKIWWNELWMSWPDEGQYAKSSNVVDAGKLPKDCKLLLIVGEMDENVDPASTMQVVSALVQADKDFEMLVIPGAGHGAAETPYGRRRRGEFLEKWLK